MNTHILSILRPSARRSVVRAALLTLTLSFSHALFAQTRQLATADIPFAFSAGAKVLPAGHYTIVRISNNIYALQRTDGAITQYFNTFGGDSPKNNTGSIIRFHQYGSTYFLEGAWFASMRTGIELYRGKAEKELLAATSPSNPAGITLALNNPSK
jgi:hypothetical protein